MRAHAALAVRRNCDKARGGRWTVAGGSRNETNTDILHAGTERLSKPVSFDLPNKNPTGAEGGQPRHRIGSRSAGDFAALGKGMIKLIGAIFVDQSHYTLGNIVFEKECIIDRRDDVDDGIAHSDDVEFPHHLYPQSSQLRL